MLSDGFKAAVASTVLAMTGAMSQGCASTPEVPIRSSANAGGKTRSNSDREKTKLNVLTKPSVKIDVKFPRPQGNEIEKVNLVRQLMENLGSHNEVGKILTKMAGMPIVVVTPELVNIKDTAFKYSEDNYDHNKPGNIPWHKYPKPFQRETRDKVSKYVNSIDNQYVKKNNKFFIEEITNNLFEQGFYHRANQIDPPGKKRAACIILSNRTLDKSRNGMRKQLAFFSDLDANQIERTYGDADGWYVLILMHELEHCISKDLHKQSEGFHYYKQELNADYEAIKYYVSAFDNDENVAAWVYARAISMVESGFTSSGAGGIGKDMSFTHAIGLALQRRLRGDELSETELSRLYGAATHIADLLKKSGSASDLKSHRKIAEGIIKARPNNYYIKDLLHLYLEGLRLLAPEASGLQPLQLETNLLTPQSPIYATVNVPSKSQCTSPRLAYQYGL